MSTRDRIRPSDFHISDCRLTYGAAQSLFGNYLFIPRMTPLSPTPLPTRNIDRTSRPLPNVVFENEVTTNTKFIARPEETGTRKEGPWKCWTQVLHSRLRRSADRDPIISRDRRCSRETLNFAFRRRRIEFSRATVQTFYTPAPRAVSAGHFFERVFNAGISLELIFRYKHER